ncbi:MAG TPA: LLM class flavin-dependent oxidoreductase [bacterium]|jgi:alkanesulfonate monooxygenase SsuD/methylene tetrahydromethanopterin reductase-like flavin-dependent oxidoreductase (luciferase family)|nr:LLM class flavin-dependent oxidoreductase [bacterium]
MARVGLAVGYDPSMTVGEMTSWMRLADERGFEMGFFSETIQLVRDSVTALAAFGSATTRLRLGATQVVRLRSPLVMAQTLAALDELTGGRIVLAPGACTISHARRHGLEHIDPPLALSEWIAAIRKILTGEPVTFEGRVIKLDGVQLSWRPLRAAIPMWIAATSRPGLQLAGRIGDGVLLNAVASPEYTANALKIVREAVDAAGRDWSTFEVAQIVNCSIEDDRRRALNAIRWELASKFNPMQLSFNARPRIAVGEPYMRTEDIPMFEEAYRQGGHEGLAAAIPDDYVEGLTASGTPEDVLRRVEQYRQAGVRLPLLRPAAQTQMPRLLDAFASTH